jgi:hypothetical protein
MSDKPKMRMLSFDLDMSKYQEIEGGLLVKDVPILACGVWTDSLQQTPLHYGPKALEDFANNWKADGYWARHTGGGPRSVMELLGDVRNRRFDPTFKRPGMTEAGALLADIFYSYSTQNGKDAAAQAIARAKIGKPLAVSVEHGGVEELDPKTQMLEAKTLEFYGLASVEKGACRVCTLPKRTDEESPRKNEENNMANEELAKMFSDAEAKILAAVDAKLAALKIPADATEAIKTMSAANDGLVKELAEAKKTIETLKVDATRRLEALEKKPNPKTSPEEQRILEAPVPSVRWDQKSGRVGGN